MALFLWVPAYHAVQKPDSPMKCRLSWPKRAIEHASFATLAHVIGNNSWLAMMANARHQFGMI
jgi:hypothetical protein